MSQRASSGVARADLPCGGLDLARRGVPATTAPLLGELSTTSTSAPRRVARHPVRGSIGPAAASTSAAISRVRREAGADAASFSRRWCVAGGGDEIPYRREDDGRRLAPGQGEWSSRGIAGRDEAGQHPRMEEADHAARGDGDERLAEHYAEGGVGGRAW